MITSKTFSVAGIGSVNTIIYTPDNTTGVLPAFMFVTGLGESGSDPSKIYINGPMHFIQAGWKPNFIVIGIQSNNVYGPMDIKGLQGVIDGLSDPSYRIDWNKYYLTGLSYGAATVGGYIQLQTDTLFKKPTALIHMSMNIYGLCGSYYDNSQYLCKNDLRFASIPAFGFCGNGDGFLDAMGKFWALLTKAGYKNKFHVYSGGHGGWNSFYDPTWKDTDGLNIYDWALQYSSGAAVIPPVVVPPVVIPPTAKTIKSITVLYTDGTTITLP